jgi:ATP-binding cassette subfamily F protein 3
LNLLQVHNALKQYGAKILFNNAGFSINQGEHVGVIGPNGAGKTTLFKIIVGQESLDSGDITKLNGLRIGYLEQESEWSLTETAEQYLQNNCLKPIWDLKQIGLGLGLSEDHFQKKLSDLSGGYRMRMKLLYLIGLEPDLMLLDEPTNFLDLESILTLEKFLQDYKQAFLLISHDREFLRRTTEYTLEVEAEEITKFPGHIDDYFEQKEELQKVLASQAANLDIKRKHIQDFIDRFKAKATKAKQAQSRMKQLDKMEKIEIKALPTRAKIQLPTPIQTGKEVLTIENADLGYDKNIVLKNVCVRIEKNQRIGIVGFNGAGKSTLLKSIAGRIPLLAGTKKLGYNVSLAYFAQHLTEDLDQNDTVLDSLQKKAYKDSTAQEILNIAGSLLFSGDTIHKKIKVLSGGEKTRVALGQILLQKHPFLLMDEPTNHLDFDTVNALAEALAAYPGTLIVVSHDRSFISRVSNQILEIRNGSVELFPGTYDDYLWSLEKGALKERYTVSDENLQKNNASISIPIEKKFNYKEESKRINGEIKELERRISKTETQLLVLNKNIDEYNSQLLTVQGPQAQQIAIASAKTSKDVSETEDTLLSLMEDLDLKQKDLLKLTTT